jgi:predicted amidophosphoribosyltransferase
VLISRYNFASYLTYCSNRGSGLKSDKRTKARNVMYCLKQEKKIGNPPMVFSRFVANRIKTNLERLSFSDYFGTDVFLVPVPGSSLMKQGDLWVPENICKALEEQGLGITFPCLERVKKVPKSAFCKCNERPKPEEHYESIKTKKLIIHMQNPSKIVLVDDLITRGSTILGCINRLKEVYPKAEMRGFAIMRTISNINDFNDIEDPCIGTVEYKENNLWRQP